MSRTKCYYDLRDALDKEGCPFCRLEEAATQRWVEGFLYESVNDTELRARVRRSRGFCHEHAWQFDRNGAALGTAIVLRDVLHNIERLLDKAAFGDKAPRGMSRLQRALQPESASRGTAHLVEELGPQAACPVCAHLRGEEADYADALVDNLLSNDEGALLERFRASDGLCVPHLRLVLRHVHEEQPYTALVTAQREIWARLEQQLDELIRKSDYRFEGEPIGAEGDSWRRAIAAVAGARRGLAKR